jgi:hypothetical protein
MTAAIPTNKIRSATPTLVADLNDTTLNMRETAGNAGRAEIPCQEDGKDKADTPERCSRKRTLSPRLHECHYR